MKNKAFMGFIDGDERSGWNVARAVDWVRARAGSRPSDWLVDMVSGFGTGGAVVWMFTGLGLWLHEGVVGFEQALKIAAGSGQGPLIGAFIGLGLMALHARSMRDEIRWDAKKRITDALKTIPPEAFIEMEASKEAALDELERCAYQEALKMFRPGKELAREEFKILGEMMDGKQGMGAERLVRV